MMNPAPIWSRSYPTSPIQSSPVVPGIRFREFYISDCLNHVSMINGWKNQNQIICIGSWNRLINIHGFSDFFSYPMIEFTCRIIRRSTIELQLKFNEDVPDHLRKPATYSRNLLEYCSYQALQLLTKTPNYLADKKFRRLTYDMMLAWEAPRSNELKTKVNVFIVLGLLYWTCYQFFIIYGDRMISAITHRRLMMKMTGRFFTQTPWVWQFRLSVIFCFQFN